MTLGPDQYLGITSKAFVEILVALIIFFLIVKTKKRASVVVFSVVGVACSVFCVFLRKKSIRFVMEVVAFFASVIIFSLGLIYFILVFDEI